MRETAPFVVSWSPKRSDTAETSKTCVVVLITQRSRGSCKELRRLISAGVPGLHEHPRLVR